MRRHSDSLRGANATTKEGANGGENARASVLRSEGVCSPVKIKIPVASADMRRHSDTLRGVQRRRKRGLRGENRGIHGRDPCRLTWAISGDFRLVVLGILLYSCVLRTKTRSKIAPWQVQRSFARRICAKAMKRPQTIRSLLARALKMHRCKSVGQNRHVSLPCMP